ncbi:hypothetical protein M758_2G118800 [Ceratodon purpureus]|nr:hypothetical protein M758_2G118800 [Ceratodon purpureus]
MPAPEVLLNSVTGQSDQTLGCMTGLFHIFEGHPAFMGRRYSSTRVGIHSGQSQLRTQVDSQPQRHDRRDNSFSKVDDTQMKAVRSTKQHHRSHSDVSVNPSRTLSDFCTLKDGNGSDRIEPTPTYSEGTVDALTLFNNESLRAAALLAGDSRRRSDLDHREFRNLQKVVVPKARVVDNDLSASDVRDVILASFQRDMECSESTKANSDQSLNSSRNQSSLKNRRDGCQKDRKRSASRESVDLPRPSSVYARSCEPTELVNWKEGLRSSASPPRKLSHHNSPERRVEPKKDRGRSLSKDHYPFASMSPKRFPASLSPNLQDRRHGEILNQDYNFKESPGASDFRESLKPFLTVQGRQSNASAQERFASRSIDSSGFSERNLVGVSHRVADSESSEHSVVPNVIARLMGLEKIPSHNQQGVPSSRVPDTRSRGDKFFRGLVQFDPQITRPTSPPPPPPCHSKNYLAHHVEKPSAYCRNEYELEGAYQDNYPAQYKLEQELWSSEEDREYEHFNSMPFLPFEDDYQEGAHQASGKVAESRELLDPTTQAEDINIVAPEKKKKMIRKILEAMHPKVFLKISRRKQTEQEKSPVSKLITNDVQPVQEFFEKQQQTTLVKVVTNLKSSGGTESEELSRYSTSDTSSVKKVQEQQTYSSNSSKSSVKPCILQPDEDKSVEMKCKTRPQDSSAGTFQVRHVDTASSTSTNKETVPIKAQINKEDRNLAKDQSKEKKPVKPRVAADNTPRSARAKSTLESDYESDPSSCTQNDKSNDVRESRKVRASTRKSNPSSKSPTPDIQRRNGRCVSPEARSTSRSSPSREHCKTGEVGRKSPVVKAKKDSRVTPSSPKAQLAKEEILKKRVTEIPDDSRLRKSSSENRPTLNNAEKPATKETFSIRSAGARSRSPAAPRKLDVNRSSSSDAVTLDTSKSLDSALQPALTQPQISASEPILEHHEMVQPEPGISKDSHVDIPHTSPEVQKTERDSLGDHCGDSSEPKNLDVCIAVLEEAEPLHQMSILLQAQEATIEISEELTTPRGIPLKCENLDGKLDEEVLDRPSPISVLDTMTFVEELTPSPSTPRHSFSVLQDSETTYNDEGYENCDKDLEAYHETPAFVGDNLEFDGTFSHCAEELRAEGEKTDTKIRLDKFQSYFKDAKVGEEKAFVENFLLAPEVATSCRLRDSSCVINSSASKKFNLDTENINEKLLESLQSIGILQENNHILLLDCLEEIMERILESETNLMLWAGLPPETICERTKGKRLEQELWMELRDTKCIASSEDICETVHRLLQRDLIKSQGRQWSTFRKDREQIGTDMEKMIFEDLIEEAVRDFCALQWDKLSLPAEATRRQLFTY